MVILLSIVLIILLYYVVIRIFKATCNHKWVSAKNGRVVCKKCNSDISDFIDLLR